MTLPLTLVVLYLWVAGGFGWARQHEQSKHRTLTPMGRAVIVLSWPYLVGFAALAEGATRLARAITRPA